MSRSPARTHRVWAAFGLPSASTDDTIPSPAIQNAFKNIDKAEYRAGSGNANEIARYEGSEFTLLSSPLQVPASRHSQTPLFNRQPGEPLGIPTQAEALPCMKPGVIAEQNNTTHPLLVL